MSQIAFKAKTQNADFVVDIKSIKLHNTINGNTFTFPATAETEPTQSNWANTAVAPIGAITIGMDETKTLQVQEQMFSLNQHCSFLRN